MKITIVVNSTNFEIKYDGGGISYIYFIQVISILKDGTNININTQLGPQVIPYADLLSYDGSGPTSITAVITDMNSHCGITITAGGSANIDLVNVGGTAIDTDTGSNSAGTQRMTISDDDPLTFQIEKNQHNVSAVTVVQGVVDVGTVDDTYVDAGSEIDMTDYNTLTLFCELLIQDSTGVKIKFESVHTAAGTEFDGIEDDQYIYAFSNVNQNKKIVFKTNNGTPLLQIKTKGAVLGVTEATMAINCVKSWE